MYFKEKFIVNKCQMVCEKKTNKKKRCYSCVKNFFFLDLVVKEPPELFCGFIFEFVERYILSYLLTNQTWSHALVKLGIGFLGANCFS